MLNELFRVLKNIVHGAGGGAETRGGASCNVGGFVLESEEGMCAGLSSFKTPPPMDASEI